MKKHLDKHWMGIALAASLFLVSPGASAQNNVSQTIDNLATATNQEQTPDEAENAPEERTEEPVEQAAEEPKKDFVIASWGGAYMQAQDNAYITPYKKSSDLEVRLQQHSGDYASIKTKLGSPEGGWDIVDLSYGMVDKACKAGLLETLNYENLDPTPEGNPAETDFIIGGLHKCGVGTMAWSSIVIYNKKSFRRRKPASARDFFNIRRYRGKRTLPKTAENVLELALLADGVQPQDIYKTLETPSGINRAFKKLGSIKKHVRWWSNPSEPFRLLSEGKASMGIAYSGRAFSAIAEQKKTIGIIWDGQVYDMNLWAIPKSSPYKKDARHFLAYATNPQRLALQASWFPYGPARKSSIKLIKPHPEAGIDMKPYVPTMPRNLKLALQKDKNWWEANRPLLQARFDRWLRNEPEPKPVPVATSDKNIPIQSEFPKIEEAEAPSE